jgi:hypothetical protein
MPRTKLSRPWTKEEDEALLRMRAEGKAYELIAAHLRRSPKGVERRYRILLARARA